MRRKIIFGVICTVFIVIGSLGLFTETTLGIMILPLTIIGDGLRWLSLEGAFLNFISIVLLIGLGSLPLVFLGYSIKKEIATKADLIFLPLLTIVFSFCIYYFINPNLLFGMTSDLIQQTISSDDLKNLELILLSGVGYIFYIVLIIYILLKLYFSNKLGNIRFFRILLSITIIIYSYSILSIELASVINRLRLSVVSVEEALIIFEYAAELALFGLTIYLLLLFEQLIGDIDKDGFQDGLIELLNKLQNASLILLIGTLALQGIVNFVQFLIMSKLNDVNFSLDMPIGMMIIVLMILIFSRYVSRVIEMRKENELII